MSYVHQIRATDPHRPVATVASPAGAAYRGKAGCKNIRCSQDSNPDRCYGWHCLICDGLSNCQGDCSTCTRRARNGLGAA